VTDGSSRPLYSLHNLWVGRRRNLSLVVSVRNSGTHGFNCCRCANYCAYTDSLHDCRRPKNILVRRVCLSRHVARDLFNIFGRAKLRSCLLVPDLLFPLLYLLVLLLVVLLLLGL
jgi:hypothetical protein